MRFPRYSMIITIWVFVFSALINEMIKDFDRTVHSLFIVEDCNILVILFSGLILRRNLWVDARVVFDYCPQRVLIIS